MSTLLYILPILILIRLFNHYRKMNLSLKVENDVRAMRNKLRLAGIENKKLRNHPTFEHVDYIIARVEPEIKRINIWLIIYSVFFLKEEEKKEARGSKPEIYFNKENLVLKKFYDDYTDLTFKYLVKKNIFSLFITFFVMKTTTHLSSRLNRWVVTTKNSIKYNFLMKQESYYTT